MRNLQRRVQLTVLATALATAVLQPAIAAADQTGQSTQATSAIEVVANGLDTPRGLIYDGNTDRVLVAEAGTGGPSRPNGGICGAANGGALYCYGPTGAVFQYSTRDGTARRIITGLPSMANYNRTTGAKASVLGLHDLSQSPHGQLRGIFGLSGAQTPFRDVQLVGGGAPDAVAFGQVVRFPGKSGSWQAEADLAAYEQVNNPHSENPYGGPIIDSDPFGMYSDADGTVVADAAGNDLLLVRPDGSIEVLYVFPNRQPAPQPTDINWNIESVPSTVTRGPDGAYYVGELTGFPYYRDEAKVWRVVPGQPATLAAQGFTNIADITFDGQGRLVVLEMSREGLFAAREAIGGGQTPAHNGDTVTGRLVRVEPNGTQTTLAMAGLQNPGGVAYAGVVNGQSVFYVTNRTTGVGGNGQLLKITVTG